MTKRAFIGLSVLFSILPRSTLADQASFKYGLGIINGAPTSQVKAFGFRYEEAAGLFDLHLAAEAGLFTDTGSAQGRKGSVIGKYQLGIRPEAGALYFKSFWGLAGITGPDSQLGGPFPQFALDTGFGFQSRSSFVGLNYSHISSAGIFNVNKGRDFIQAEMGLRF